MKPDELKALVKAHRAALTGERLAGLCATLGVRPATLRHYGVGYAADMDLHTLPAVNGAMAPVGLWTLGPEWDMGWIGDRKGRSGVVAPAGFLDPVPDFVEGKSEGVALVHVVTGDMPEILRAADTGWEVVGRLTESGDSAENLRWLMLAAKNRGSERSAVVVARTADVVWVGDSPTLPGIEGAIGLAGVLRVPCAAAWVRFPSGRVDEATEQNAAAWRWYVGRRKEQALAEKKTRRGAA